MNSQRNAESEIVMNQKNSCTIQHTLLEIIYNTTIKSSLKQIRNN